MHDVAYMFQHRRKSARFLGPKHFSEVVFFDSNVTVLIGEDIEYFPGQQGCQVKLELQGRKACYCRAIRHAEDFLFALSCSLAPF